MLQVLFYIFKQLVLSRQFYVTLEVIDHLGEVMTQSFVINAPRDWSPPKMIMILLFVSKIIPDL